MQYYILWNKETYVPYRFAELPPQIEEFACKVDVIIGDWLQGKENYVLKTSGSTGKPKEIPFTREQLIISAKQSGEAFELQKGDKILLPLDIAHVAGFMMVIRALELELELYVVFPSTNPLEHVPNNLNFNFSAFVPMQMATMIGNSYSISKLEAMKSIIVGGTSIGGELMDKFKQLKVPVYHTFGMTETLTHVAIKRLNGEPAVDYYKALPGTTFGIDNRNCLIIYSPITGGNPLITNDVVELIDEKRFRWKGRYDFVINTGGFKIQPEELEKKLRPFISGNFFIWKKDDEALGEKVILVIKGEEFELDYEKIRKALHKYEMPRVVKFVNEFKYLASGKLDKAGTASD